MLYTETRSHTMPSTKYTQQFGHMTFQSTVDCIHDGSLTRFCYLVMLQPS
jgi:hypothetical protein